MKKTILYLFALVLCTLISCNKESQVADLVPLTVMEDSSLPAITINGVKLHAETFGNPLHPMIVVLHGGPGVDYRSNLNFKHLADDSLFVVFYDQRGSGLSQRLEKDAYPHVQVFIDELDGVIQYYRQSNRQPVVLAGHSWGAMLATAYINQKPNEITGLILAEPGGFNWEQTSAYIGRSRPLKLFDEATNDFVYQDQFLSGSDHRLLDYKMILSTAGDSNTGDLTGPPFWRYGAVCSSASFQLVAEDPDQLDFTTNLSNYTTKVLFVYSELNTSYGQEHAEFVSSELPNVQLVRIDGCGHEIPHFGWDNYYPHIKTYLNEIL